MLYMQCAPMKDGGQRVAFVSRLIGPRGSLCTDYSFGDLGHVFDNQVFDRENRGANEGEKSPDPRFSF
jgi:hypothetical protein